MSGSRNNNKSIKILEVDPWLEPFSDVITKRMQQCDNWLNTFKNEGSLTQFIHSYKKYGFNKTEDGDGIKYVEHAPNAIEASLVGDFNGWDVNKHKMNRDEFGNFSILIKNNQDGSSPIKHGSKIKISLLTKQGERLFRLPVWINRVEQDINTSPIYDAVYWDPPKKYEWKYNRPSNKLNKLKNGSLKVYEAHVGISSNEPKVCSYKEFTNNVLPRIKELGYDAVQLMAIMEHPYYASFGYQITSMFAVSSRFGSPEEFKELVDTAHKLGLVVLLDVVHSHACNNVEDGMNMFDGTDYLYFHSGTKGKHELWNSRLFNYSSYETLRLLLSNLAFYIEEYKIDGFRFDGVTSIMYKHHGIGYGFSGDYKEYFNEDLADTDGIVYLMLANKIMHDIYPFVITIAEDVSGMPGLARSVDEGGIGFDYKLGMAIPDMWIKILKEKSDNEWDIGSIVHTLTNRRYKENTIAYCESHDQALVGDKSIAFWLMDKEMYTNMSDLSPLTITIDRGIALHKLIRLITHSLGGEGYLNFEGNEFGHPEWLDFPRQGNNNSFHYCKRQWNLPDDKLLRYKYLNLFDKEINTKENEYNWLCSPQAYVSLKHEDDKIVVFERNNLVFIFNFHPTKSYENYKIGCNNKGKYKIIINSDIKEFGGHNRVDINSKYFTQDEKWNDRNFSLMVYIPTRTALVLALDNN